MPCSSVLRPLRGIGFALLALPGTFGLPAEVGAQEPPGDASSAVSVDTLRALDAALSPDGRVVAFRVSQDGAPRLFVTAALDTLGAARPLTPADVSVGSYAWAPDADHVVFTDDAGRGLRVTRVPGGLGGPAGDFVAPGTPASELIPGSEGPVRIVGFAPDPLAALVELPGAWPDAPDLVRVALASGARSVVIRNEGGVRSWITDDAGTPRLAIREDEGGGTELARYRDGEFVPVYRCAAEERCEPVGFHPDGRVWLRSDRGRDVPALLLRDPLTAETEVVRADLRDDPRAAFEDDVTFTEATASVRAAVADDAALTFHAAAADGGRHLVTVRGPDGSELLLFDRWSGVVEPLLPLAEATSPLLAAAAADPSALAPARLGYRITEEGSPTPAVDMVRRIERATEDGVPVWRVVDDAEVPTFEMPDVETDIMAEDPDAIDDLLGDDPSFDPFEQAGEPTGSTRATDTVVLDGSTLAPLRRRADGAFRIELDFGEGLVRGVTESQGFETPIEVDTDGPVWSDGAALETLVAAMPLMEGYRAVVPVLETQTSELDTLEVSVRGTERVTTRAGSFDTWRLTLSSSASPDRREEWLVRRAAPHYLVRAETRLEGVVRITELTDAGGLP